MINVNEVVFHLMPINLLSSIYIFIILLVFFTFSLYSFQKGDIFFVHNDMTDGWLWVTAHRTGEQGMIFRELVQDLDGNIDPNSVFSWFHPNITKTDAVDLLVKG